MRKLMAYYSEIKYKPGPSNKVADALSRKFSSSVGCGVLISIHNPQWADLQQQIAADPFIKQLKHNIEEDQQATGSKGLHSGSGVLRHKGRIVIPKSALVQQLLHEYHDSPTCGH